MRKLASALAERTRSRCAGVSVGYCDCSDARMALSSLPRSLPCASARATCQRLRLPAA